MKKIFKQINQWYNSEKILWYRTFFASFLTNGRKWEERCKKEKELQK